MCLTTIRQFDCAEDCIEGTRMARVEKKIAACAKNAFSRQEDGKREDNTQGMLSGVKIGLSSTWHSGYSWVAITGLSHVVPELDIEDWKVFSRFSEEL